MIIYNTMIIDSPDLIDICPVFNVDNEQWTCKRKPSTQGRMAYIPGKGLLVSMHCDEKNPLRTVTENMGRVCADSAVVYPPAIPLALPGQILENGVIDYMEMMTPNKKVWVLQN